MRRTTLLGMLSIGCAAIFGCGGDDGSHLGTGGATTTGSVGNGSGSSGTDSGSFSGTTGAGPSAGAGTTSGGTTTGTTTTGAGGGTPQPGMLTAADWDDNLNFDFFQWYLDQYLLQWQGATLSSADRIVVTVTGNNAEPIANALVTITGGATQFISVRTATDGRALFFPQRDGAPQAGSWTVHVEPPPAQTNVQPITIPAPQGTDWSITLPGAVKALPLSLELAFVVDTTGSMGDELNYLKVELQDIVNQLTQAYSGLAIRYALVVYRDVGDAYVTRMFDFTPDLGAFATNLAAQSSDGGGDEPEAMEQGLADMNALSWTDGNVVRMAFFVADAPPHVENGATFFQHVDVSRAQAIKVYPIAASGAADEAEYYLRHLAESTLGRYLFLTDDSGIGLPHDEPTIPCYQVQHLNKLMVRMISSELSGVRVPADPADVIRTVGDPQGNVCTLQDGSTVSF